MQRHTDAKLYSIFSEPKIDAICVIGFFLNNVLSVNAVGAFSLWGLETYMKNFVLNFFP